MNAVFIFVFVENASEGRLIVVRYVGLKAIVDVTERHRDAIAAVKEAKRCIVWQREDEDGECGKGMKNMGIVTYQKRGQITVMELL